MTDAREAKRPPRLRIATPQDAGELYLLIDSNGNLNKYGVLTNVHPYFCIPSYKFTPYVVAPPLDLQALAEKINSALYEEVILQCTHEERIAEILAVLEAEL